MPTLIGRTFTDWEVLDVFRSEWQRRSGQYGSVHPFVTHEWQAVGSAVAVLLNQATGSLSIRMEPDGELADLRAVDIEILERATMSMAMEIERRKKAGT